MSNILVIKHGSLGDIAQACGAIQDISENHKNDQIHLLTTKPYFDYQTWFSRRYSASLWCNSRHF